MATKREDFLKELLATFRVEGEEHVQKLGEGLLALERTSEPESRLAIIETIYRAAHSLKGASRAVGLRDVEIVCQALESVLAGFKRGTLQISSDLLDLLHGANDLTGRLIAAQGAVIPADLELVDPFSKELEKAAAGLEARAPVARSRAPVPESASAQPNDDVRIAKPAAISSIVEQRAAVSQVQPSAVEASLTDTSSRSESPSMHSPIEAAPGSQPVAPASASAAPRTQTVRVNTAQLDMLLRQTEEMVGVRLAMEHRAAGMAEINESVQDWRRRWKKLGPAHRELKRRLSQELDQTAISASRTRHMKELFDLLEGQQYQLTWLENRLREFKFQIDQDRRALGLMLDGLRGGVRQTLMLPFAHLLASFPRMVRDLARDLAKVVEFTIEGEQVQVEKRILEELKDPLLHLVRNALDHGVETPEVRRNAGKPESSNLRLTISQAGGGRIEIALADDGRGLDPEKLRYESVKRKLLTAEQAEKLSDEQALGLVFHSGFSTSAKVTDLSGRGLGMAIVREKVETLGGGLSIENRPGQGATFWMNLPASMAATRGILVQASDRQFCVPTNGVERVLRFASESLRTIEGSPTIDWQQQRVAYVGLSRLLNLPDSKKEAGSGRQIVALMIRVGEERLALGVDRVVGEQEVLVKGLGSQIIRLRHVAGTTVLGNGELVPILHIPDLIQSAHNQTGGLQGAAHAGAAERLPARILVADDSITTRTLIKNILEEGGYAVTTAIDGAEALSLLLEQEAFDLLLSDVEMPQLDGFELCKKIREDSRLADLPVVLCTSLGSPEDRQRGVEAGANAYIVKRDFEHGHLLEIIAQLI